MHSSHETFNNSAISGFWGELWQEEKIASLRERLSQGVALSEICREMSNCDGETVAMVQLLSGRSEEGDKGQESS